MSRHTSETIPLRLGTNSWIVSSTHGTKTHTASVAHVPAWATLFVGEGPSTTRPFSAGRSLPAPRSPTRDPRSQTGRSAHDATMPSTRYSEKCPSFRTTWFIAWVPRMPSAARSGETRETTERLSASDATPGTSE